ncbi:MAG TPA: DUF6677 family protein [Candidatus Cybelea sp.]|nr:DUF6677 family protein [Candidatus Cybelea sp.]
MAGSEASRGETLPMGTVEAPVREGPPSNDLVATASEGRSRTATPVTRLGRAAFAAFIVILAWAVPGLGHLLERRLIRAAVFFAAVGGLAVSGCLMRGNVFAAHSPDPFGTLGFLADAGSGLFYWLSRFFESAGPDVSRAMGDYGTRFIAAAGIVNALGICDAYEIARRRRC